jgi:hypothetical protein
MPETGGRVDFASEHGEQAMLVLGAVVEAGSDPDEHPGADRDGRQDAGPGSLPRRPAAVRVRLADAGTHPNKARRAHGRGRAECKKCKCADPLDGRRERL